MKILVEAGANINIKTINSTPKLRGQNYGDTALIWASGEGHDQVVKFLIDKLEKPQSKSLYRAKTEDCNFLEINLVSCLRDCENCTPQKRSNSKQMVC